MRDVSLFRKMAGVGCAAGMLAVAASAYAGNYLWKGAQYTWSDWNDVSNWCVTNDNAACVDATTPPGVDDAVVTMQGYEQHLWIDLKGQDVTLGTLNWDSGWRAPQSNLSLTNGTFTVAKFYEFYGNGTDNTLWNGAAFTVADTVANCYEGRSNASCPPWRIKAGGTLNMLARKLNLFQTFVTVEAGGVFRLEPQAVTWSGSGCWPNRYVNSGTFVMTNGFDMAGSSVPKNSTSTLYLQAAQTQERLLRNGWSSYISFDHLGGTLRLGGTISNGGLADGAYYMTWQNGCAVEVVRDLAIEGFDCAVSNNATVALSVAAGARADLSGFVYGENTAVTKRGAGTMVLGEGQPASLAVEEGAVELAASAADVSRMSFSDGTRIVFGYDGTVRIDALENFANLDFELSTEKVDAGTEFFASASAELRARVKARVAAHLLDTLEVAEDGEKLVLLAKEENVIDVSANVNLADCASYAGKAVVLRGRGVVTLGADAPAFASLSLELGATLNVQGGSEAAPIDVPQVSVAQSSRLVVADGSFACLTNGWSFAASDTAIGVFEIETNGIAFVRDPAWPSKPITFKNVDFRLYGQLRVPDASSDNNYVGSQMYFGYAENGETGHLAFSAIGGSIYAHHTAAAYMGNRALVAIASPAAGGRVKVMGTVLFRDFRKIQDLATPDNPKIGYANSGYYFGVNNPVDETFDVVVDDTLMAPGGPTRFAGGSRVLFCNGASLIRPEYENCQMFGHTRGVFIQDEAKVSFDGGQLYLDRCCGSASLGLGLNVTTKSAGARSLVLDGGVELTLWETWGDAGAVCEVTDARFTVPLMLPPRLLYNANTASWYMFTGVSVTNTPAFNGFRQVDILEGGRLVFDASDHYYLQGCNNQSKDILNPLVDVWWTDWWEWNRKTALEIPVSGSGDLLVTNTLSGADPRNGSTLVPSSLKPFPDVECWEMNLVMRCPSNTCTGVLRTATDVKAYVQFANGANWAGTVVGNDHVRLGDSIAELTAAEAPARATFGAVSFEGDLPIRLWKDGTTQTNDFLEITGACTTREGGLAGACRNGYRPDTSDRFRVARCLKANPPTAARGWCVKLVDDPADPLRAFVDLKYAPPGTLVILQ